MSGNRVARGLAGILAGLLTGIVELVFLLLAGVTPVARPGVGRVADRLVALERARLAAWFGHDTGEAAPVRNRYGYLALRAVVGVVGGYVAAAGLFLGFLFLFGGTWALLTRESDAVRLVLPGVRLVTSGWAIGLTSGLLVVALAGLWCLALVAVERRLADHFLGPGRQEMMRRRIAELTATRSGIVRAVDDERRRIERDLHDGVQQRGVALSMLLGRAEHSDDPAKAAALVSQAYTESRRLLDELRSVAWRIYPTALDELGLRAALAGVAERASVPVTVHYGLAESPVSEVETALYFVAREAVTNATKHARARDILVVLTQDDRTVSIVISDDGHGGADPAGSGLAGLARRVLALDGRFEVDSPSGGPTRITATLPRAAPCE